MGASNHPGLYFAKPRPSVLDKIDRRRAKASALDKAYQKVDERDGSVCWVTGKRLTPGHKLAEFRREHHHLRGRVGANLSNAHFIVTVSALAHELITRHVLLVLGDDARKPIRFAWNRAMVLPNREPFRLRRQVNGERAA